MTQRILILSGIQLSTNPRVVKEANTLANAGYEVEVVTAQLERSLIERDSELFSGERWKHTPLIRAHSELLRDKTRYLIARVRRRVWKELCSIRQSGDVRQFGYVGPEMLKYSLKYPADLTIVHLPQALWVGAQLIARGHRVGVDFEDWYSEDFPASTPDPAAAASLATWERAVLKGAVYATTTSKALSDALAASYQVPSLTVLPNSFALRERQDIDGEIRDKQNRDIPSLTWFSQVIGPQRGLETLMHALNHVETSFEIHLRGKITEAYRAALLNHAPPKWQDHIFFHPQVSHRELISRVAEHDLGLVSDTPSCRSRSLTITNKALQYLLAGIGVIAADTAGQKEMAANAPGAVFSYVAGDPRDLARALNQVTANRFLLKEAAQNALRAAIETYSWEQSEAELLRHVAKALSVS